MATIRKGNKQVLLVVDVQVGVMQNNWESPRIIKNINTVVEKARNHGVPIIWVQHADDELIYDTPDWQFPPELSPAMDETRIHKQFNSAFEQTELEETLAHLGATHIVLAGAATNWCIRATAYAALDRGYDMTLLKDAHTTETMDFGGGIVIEAENIIRELNTAMNWLTYPNRTNDAVSVEDVEFTKHRE